MEKLQKLFIACTIIFFMSVVLQAACTNFDDEEDAQDGKTCCITAGQQSDGQWICTRGSVDDGCMVVAGCEDRWRVYAINEDTEEVFQQICDPMSTLSEGSGNDADGDSSGDVTNVFYPPTENPPADDDDDNASPPATDDDDTTPPTAPMLRVSYQTRGHVSEDLKLRNCFDATEVYFEQKHTSGFNVVIPRTDCLQIEIGTGRWACNAWQGNTRLDGTLHVYDYMGGTEVERLYPPRDTDPGPAYVGNCVRAD